jgi:hypothetical protein
MSSDSIKFIYNQPKSKGASYLSLILIFGVIISVYVYLYSNAQNKLLRLSWDDRKCNPRYLFFSGYINPEKKDPLTATVDNFNGCVGKSIYKDPYLYKEIKENDKRIRQHNKEIGRHLNTGEKTVQGIRKKWDETKEQKDMEAHLSKSDAGGNIEKQASMHGIVAAKSEQMFELLNHIVLYIQGILLYRVSKHKQEMNIDQMHQDYMNRYSLIYNNKYKNAFVSLDKKDWKASMNTAREAIDDFNALTDELTQFMDDHLYQLTDITESCYHLKYNLNNDDCKQKIFPNLSTSLVDAYPLLKEIFK